MWKFMFYKFFQGIPYVIYWKNTFSSFAACHFRHALISVVQRYNIRWNSLWFHYFYLRCLSWCFNCFTHICKIKKKGSVNLWVITSPFSVSTLYLIDVACEVGIWSLFDEPFLIISFHDFDLQSIEYCCYFFRLRMPILPFCWI